MTSATQWQVINATLGWMTQQECDWLSETAAMADTWTELGTYVGRSALCVGLNLRKGGRLIVVDTRFGYPEMEPCGQSWMQTFRYLANARRDLEIWTLKADSVKAAALLPDSDVVFDDADHSEAHLRLSLPAWAPKCKVHCGHDYGAAKYPGVKLAVDEIVGPVTVTGSIWSQRK